MIITISGMPGSGKSTAAKLVAKTMRYRHYSVGDFMREIARKRKLSLLQISKMAETDKTIDEELDDMQIQLGKNESNFVLDSRLGYHFIPDSFKIFLTVDTHEAAKRVFRDKRKAEEENVSLKETIENIKKRKESELKRYREYYRLNPYDKKNYDLVIDTTDQTPEDTAEKIMTAGKGK